ncbi:MAG TPA: ABC transporter substrate-binding protein, partial [Anaerolineaceae bacterium]|nr:ABC transporter substrate-binding protein [Anaerolineaceae bacterium]
MRSRIRPSLHSAGLCLAVLVVLLSACQAPTPVAPTATLAPTEQPTPAPSPTPEPRTLVICQGQEPQSLFLYSGLSKAAWSILEAIYDGPIDQRDYAEQPVILQKIPSLADGDVVLQPVDVVAGDQVVDASGNVNTLGEGVRVYPSGCSNASCAVTYDGQSPLQMDQEKVTYNLLPGLKWSDGEPLSAADSVFSYRLASSADLPVSKAVVERTVSYQAVDDITVEWLGTPGYRNARFAVTFWTPLPQHLLDSTAPADLLQAEAAARRPVGWGPYQIDEWVQGDHITLSKNPNYFRAAEGLPAFDHVVFRFLSGSGSDQLAALQSGECDILDTGSALEDQGAALDQLASSGNFTAYYTAGAEWEHLDFGIKPASYDDGLNMLGGDRPDLFGDVRTRQAFALCADRQAVVEQA